MAESEVLYMTPEPNQLSIYPLAMQCWRKQNTRVVGALEGVACLQGS